MKKLLLLLMMSLNNVASADTITYNSTSFSNKYIYGDDNSTCQKTSKWQSADFECSGGSLSGTVSYKENRFTEKFEGSDGSECDINYFGDLECTREDKSESVDDDTQLGYTPVIGENAGKSGEMMGKAIVEIFGGAASESSGESDKSGNKWEKIISNALNSNPTYGNSKYPMKGTPYYNSGTTYEWRGQYGELGFGSDGMECWFDNSDVLHCNNGVTYRQCGNAACGSDGTTYKSSNTNASSSDYYCITSSFGSKCCGTLQYKTCR